jgi:methionyl aminopeptidase
MDGKVLEKYRKAGRICAGARDMIAPRLRPGARLLDIAESIESYIRKEGGKPAFPVNVSVNDVVAHYTPSAADAKEIEPGDLVKIDIGAHVDGYIGDMAFTYCPVKSPLVQASEKVLEEGIRSLRPGVTVAEVSRSIEEAAKSLGFGVIVNLTGHTLDRFVFHGQPSIPNVANGSAYAFREGEVVALEPFLVASNGHVKDSNPTEIYRFFTERPVRLPEARLALLLARTEFSELPFAKRWLLKHMSPVKAGMALRQLEAAGAIESYPVLKEAQGRPVAQSEHTIIVAEKPLVTTRTEG